MNEITVHGNITATPVLRRGQNGEGNAFLTFAVAVNRRYYSSTKGGWVDLPTVFHQVIARYELAEHAAVSLAKGTTVTVTGHRYRLLRRQLRSNRRSVADRPR